MLCLGTVEGFATLVFGSVGLAFLDRIVDLDSFFFWLAAGNTKSKHAHEQHAQYGSS